MRTTLNIDDDTLTAAKLIARERRQSTGGLISDIIRSALASKAPLGYRNGVPLLSCEPQTKKATMKLVNALRDG